MSLIEVQHSRFQMSGSHFPHVLVCVMTKVRIQLNKGKGAEGDRINHRSLASWCLPVIMLSADRQAKAWISRFRLCKFKEKSLMESSHSPNPRRH